MFTRIQIKTSRSSTRSLMRRADPRNNRASNAHQFDEISFAKAGEGMQRSSPQKQRNSILNRFQLKQTSAHDSSSVDEVSSMKSGSGRQTNSPFRRAVGPDRSADQSPSRNRRSSPLKNSQLPGIKTKPVMTRLFSHGEESAIRFPRFASTSSLNAKSPAKLDKDWRFDGIKDKPSEFTRLNLSFLNQQFSVLEAQQPKLKNSTRRSESEKQVGHKSMDHLARQIQKNINDLDSLDDEALAASGLPDGNFTQTNATGRVF